MDTPKSKAGHRVVSLDAETVTLLKAHHNAQRRERFAAGDTTGWCSLALTASGFLRIE
ncbi:hypothetical protein ACQP1V_06290 [Microtetraspora malaysiensis]|uniref:hypothetical protein n=1 Tax=Microtetraspora malaysiensis TaxID=161358 RepID=UPI003D94FF80